MYPGDPSVYIPFKPVTSLRMNLFTRVLPALLLAVGAAPPSSAHDHAARDLGTAERFRENLPLRADATVEAVDTVPNQPPTITLAEPTDGAIFEGEDAIFSVDAFDADGTVVLVTYTYSGRTNGSIRVGGFAPSFRSGLPNFPVSE